MPKIESTSREKSCALAEADLRQALEAAGWRFTRQRAAVYSYLCSVHDHPTAEDVYNAVRQTIPNISLATVYKSLEALVACRLASRLSFSDGPTRYDCRADNHYHLRCLKTGAIRDLDIERDPDLLDKLSPTLIEDLRKAGFHVTDYRLELVGHFDQPQCQ